jgi:TPR repeat protein
VTFILAACAAWGAELPGLAVPFQIDAEGRWVLAAELPPGLAEAGARPGWILSAIDGEPMSDALGAQRRVASGPSRNVRLHFMDPAPALPAEGAAAPPPAEGAAVAEVMTETVLVVRRAPLVHVGHVATVPLPDGFAAPPGPWQEDWAGDAILPDTSGVPWSLDAATGTFGPANAGDRELRVVPDMYWTLSDATWVIDEPDGVTLGDNTWARGELDGSTRLGGWMDASGEHLAVRRADGIDVFAVEWPRGTPALPVCVASVPETCLASGLEVIAHLGDRPGGREEALRHLGVACANGVHRGCYEAVAIEDPATAPAVASCMEGDPGACNDVARARFDLDPTNPDDLVIGLLDYACALEGSGTLGERLRRLEDVGAGCMLLAESYDLRSMPDQALLSLDLACVLGRAEACEQAADRRHQAFAARTVRECEDETVPIAASCVELGKLLQMGPVPAATIDDFSAFLRGCSLGAAEGCLLLGDYVDRWGIDNPRVADAETRLQQSCRAGEQRACLGAAHLLVRHEPKTKAYGEALGLFDGACAGGLGPACVGGATQRRIGTAKRVKARSQVELWQAACDLHDAEGCAGLGDRMSKSKKTWTEAYVAWNRACDLGHAHACSELGRLVEKKHSPPWEGEQAQELYLTRGCDNGDPEGCFWLAEPDIPVSGEPPEPTYLLLDRSCEGEYGEGCASLATVHLDRKTSFDDEIAARHLGTACDNGFYDSCKTLGGMYLVGKGVERDRQRANELLDKFRLNAKKKHIRIGVGAGLPNAVSAELEIVVPVPIGPALSISGAYGYIPGGGTIMVQLDGDDAPETAPDLETIGFSARLYSNPQARGVYGAAGIHQNTARGGSLTEDNVRTGWSARVGLRNDVKAMYSGVEFGIGQLGQIDLSDNGEDDAIPLIYPFFGFSFGVAFL